MSDEANNPVDPRVELARVRTSLATYRTGLALDRTTLAWVRTSLAMASFGFGMVAFFRTLVERSPGAESLRWHRDAIRIGTALVLLGIVATTLAAMSHRSALRSLRRHEIPAPASWPLSVAVALLTVIFGLGSVWILFAP